MLPDVVLFVGGCQHFALINEVHLERLKHFRFGKMPNAHFSHHGNGDGPHDLADDLDRSHSRHATFFTNVRWHPFQSHDRAGSCALCNLGLLGVGHVHDDAALEHLRQAHLHPPFVGIAVCTAASIHFLRIHVTSPLSPNVSVYFYRQNSTCSVPLTAVCFARGLFLRGRSPQISLCLWPAPHRRYCEFLQPGTGCALVPASRSLRR